MADYIEREAADKALTLAPAAGRRWTEVPNETMAKQ